MQPELLTPIRLIMRAGRPNLDMAVRFILNDRFWLQQKWDGERLMVRRFGEQVEGWNKRGQTTDVPKALTSALLSISVPHFILDGEYEQSGYYCWDVLAVNEEDLRPYPYSARYQVLQPFGACPFLQILPSWRTADDKERRVFEFLQKGAEGVVFKDSEAPYRPGRAGQHFKLKFEKTATVRVRSVDSSRDRATVEMLEHGAWREVSGIKVKQGSIKVGDYIEVRYSSASESKRLVRVVFIRRRNDSSDQDCSLDQLEFSGRWAHLRKS